MKIDIIASPPGADVYYTDRFRSIIEDHMTFLRTHPQTYAKEVSSAQAYKWEGDFFGLLVELNIQDQYHWIVMRMNNMTSPVYSSDTITSVVVPAPEVIERIRSAYMNVNKIKN